MSSIHGRLPHTKGKEPESKKFIGGTLFYDHASTHIHIVPRFLTAREGVVTQQIIVWTQEWPQKLLVVLEREA